MRGEQEDALEFLEFVLEYLHSEYEKSGLTLPNCLLKKTNQSKNSMINSSNIIAQNGWEEVRKGRTTAVLHENPVDNIQSPINFLFKGFLRTETKQRGKKETSITIEPFHCVHLNLSNTTSTSPAGLTGTTISTTSNTGKTTTMDEMLRDAFTVEIIDEKIQRHTKIETLPIVLTVHIKRFMYHPEKGPVKLQHCVQYPIEFTFPRELTNQYKEENVKYKLFAVISHHGQFVIGGHYTCVCRDNKEQWFHYDDEKVTSISEAQALTENAYMLFYIRT
jgi:ubiquitin carboxyl-terminal hydrolase 10